MKILKLLSITLLILFNYGIIKAKTHNSSVDEISKNLRCLICQGQSIYDSQSDFAISMKKLIQTKIDNGMTDKQIYDYLKTKYGEWIVYEPEFSKNTYLLWILPLILFAFGGFLILRKTSIN